MQHKLICLMLCGFLVVFALDENPSEKPSLRGVTILYTPFVTQYSDTFQGFLVNLMNKISEKVGFDFQLYLSPDGTYGRPNPNGSIKGMIGEVNQTKADFALADLIISENRKPFVDFTTPYMTTHLAIVINKVHSMCMSTIEHLINFNDREEEYSELIIPIGFLGSGTTYKVLSTTNDTIGKKLFEYAMRDRANMVKSNWEGVQRARDSRFAMILASDAAKYDANFICNLTVLRDNRDLVKFEYGIALPKGSKWLEPFNRAIQELKDDGSIEMLRKSYWFNYCTH